MAAQVTPCFAAYLLSHRPQIRIEFAEADVLLRPPPALIVLHTSNLALPQIFAAARSVRDPLPDDSVWGQTASDRYRSEP